MTQRTYCVYNKTRESFLCLGVLAADTHFARLKGLIGRLTLRLDEGLWVVPSSGVHTVGVLFPLDLVYLDEAHSVVHLIEHFPMFRVAPFKPQAASVLQLPTHTIYPSQTQVGDQLIICPAEEMELRLRRVFLDTPEEKPKDPPEGTAQDPAVQNPPAVERSTIEEFQMKIASARTLRTFSERDATSMPSPGLRAVWDRKVATIPVEEERSSSSALEEESPKETQRPPGIAGRTGRAKMNPIWGWLANWTKEDPRGSVRRDTSRIVAYYWDGAAPEPHPIRNISVSGAFLVTEQRWRPGTIVTMTLQKTGESADDPLRSLAVQAKVMRTTEDGVGIKFMFPQAVKARGEVLLMGETADRRALLAFLQTVREG